MRLPSWVIKTLFLPGFLVLLALPTTAKAQLAGGLLDKIVNEGVSFVGFYAGTFRLNIDKAPDDALPEIKGYTDVLPSRLEGNIAAIQFGLKSFSVTFSFIESTFDINKKADIAQTPTDSSDDVFVFSGKRKGNQLIISFHPISFVSLGLGQDKSDVTFQQRSTSGMEEERTIAVDNTFVFFNLVFALDFKNVAPLITFNVAVPFDIGEFSINRQPFFGTTTSLMLGVVF